VKEEGVGNQVLYAVVVHCAMQQRVRNLCTGSAAVVVISSSLIWNPF
jgi:hypothetical protein